MITRASLLIISILISSCHSDPFQTTLANYDIRFPTTQREFINSHKNYYQQGSGRYIDSSATVRVEWLFSPFGAITTEVPNARKIYGVNIYFKNKADQLDSVKAALERKYKRPLLPMTITVTDNEPHFGPAGYYCQLNDDAVLFLRKASCPQGDSWCQYNSLRIAIGYDLSKAEQERFAASYGQIWYNVD